MPHTEEQAEKMRTEALEREIMDLRVYVVGGGFQYIKMLHEAGFKGGTGVADSNIVLFTGGSDVDPSLYNERPLQGTYFDRNRDKIEQEIFADAAAAQKPMIGICRGSQFLTVMNGGKLWQDVNHHAVGSGHKILDLRTGTERFNMTSTHHQMMRPPETDAEIIAVASRSTTKKCENEEINLEEPEENADIEVVWYPKTMCLAFQPHPEFHHGECRDYFLDLVDNYILPAC